MAMMKLKAALATILIGTLVVCGVMIGGDAQPVPAAGGAQPAAAGGAAGAAAGAAPAAAGAAGAAPAAGAAAGAAPTAGAAAGAVPAAGAAAGAVPAAGGGCVIDVVAKGAVADEKTDMSPALMAAFKEACCSPTPVTILVPKGCYFLNQAIMAGPCKAPIVFRLEGTIKGTVGPPPLKDDWFTFNNVENLTITGGGTLDGQGPTVWGKTCQTGQYCKNFPINLRLNFVINGLISNITVLNSKQFQVNVIGCRNVTFQCVKVIAPGDSQNTDGIHIAKSSDITIIDTVIQTGDDCISIGDGARNLKIEKVTCGPGHGISVGSLGKNPDEEPVTGVCLKNCTFVGTDNGVRIKTWPDSHPGAVSECHYEDIIMNNVSNPIVIDQVYCPWNQCKKEIPSKVKLSNISFKNIRGTSRTKEVVTLACSGSCPCDGVAVSDIDLTYAGPEPPVFACENVKPTLVGRLNPPACTAKPPADLPK